MRMISLSAQAKCAAMCASVAKEQLPFWTSRSVAFRPAAGPLKGGAVHGLTQFANTALMYRPLA